MQCLPPFCLKQYRFQGCDGKKCMQRSKFNAPVLICTRGGSYQFMLNEIRNGSYRVRKCGREKKERCCKALGWEPGLESDVWLSK